MTGLSTTAACARCDWTAGPGDDMLAIFKLAEKHTRSGPGHPTMTTAVPA